MRTSSALVIVTTLTVTGCGALGFGEKLYEAQKLELSGSRRSLADIIVAYADLQQWAVVSRSVGPNPTVEAVSPNVNISGMGMRNRWLFWVQDNEIAAEMRLEVRFDPAVDVWESSPVLCDTYAYENERRHLQALQEFANRRSRQATLATGDSTVRN